MKRTNKQKILDISKKLGLSHIGSNLNVLSVLEEIYEQKPFRVVMSNGHSHLSHLLFLDPLGSHVEKAIAHDIHCNKRSGCDASGGSLGHGIGIGIGMALAYPNQNIYVTVSDGSLQEGSEWEALRIARDLKLNNLHIYTCLNGYTAVARIDRKKLGSKLKAFYPGIQIRLTNNGKGFEGLQGHYKTI